MKIHIQNKALLLVVVVILTILTTRPIDNFDIWWHLHSGLWMLTNWHVLDHELWSFTRTESPWINIAWFFQLLIALSYKLGGLWGLFLFKAILIFSAFSIIVASINTKRKVIPFLLAALVLLPFIYGHLHLRPNLLEIIVLLFLVLLSQRFCNLRIVFVAFLLLLILANSHASVIVGSVAFALHVLLGKWEIEPPWKTKMIASFVILLTTYLTPYGFDILKLLFAHDSSDLIQYYINEWVPHNVYPLGLWLIFLLVLFFVINNKLKSNITESFFLIFFLWYSIKFQRFELELAFLLIRPFAEIIGYGFLSISAKNKKVPVLLATLLLLMHGVIYANQYANLAPSLYADLPSNKFNYPVVTVKQLSNLADKLNRKVKVINDYDYGGYIALFTNAKAKVLVDGRMTTVYPESLLLPPYETDTVILQSLARRYDVDAILLKLDRAAVISVDDPEWQIIAYDSASVLFIKRLHAKTLSVPQISYNPGTYRSTYSPVQLQEYKRETLKLLELEPQNPMALNHMAVFLSGDIDSAQSRRQVLTYLEQSQVLNPTGIFSQATHAYVLATTSSHVKSIAPDFLKFLPAANKLNSGISLSYDIVYSKTLIDLGLSHLALEYLYPEIKDRRYGLDKIIDVWKLRIIAHAKMGELDKARNCLAIANELVAENNILEIENIRQLANMIDEKIH